MKKILKNAVIILLVLTLGTAAAFLAYLHFSAPDDEALSGEWTADLDMTKQSAAQAFGWLQDIEGVSVSLEELESRMQDLTIQVNLTFEQTDSAAGTFQCHVSPESYEACSQAAYETVAAVFRELLAERLHMAGYTDGMDEESLEALVTETFGMSTEAYLMSCGPELLPALYELQAQYDGSGTYETAEGVLTRQFDSGGAVTTRVESYIRQNSSLVLCEELGSVPAGFSPEEYPVLYHLRQSADDTGREMP